MSRKGAAPKREVLADPIYNSKKVTNANAEAVVSEEIADTNDEEIL